MEFGKVPSSALATIDFTLPPDAPLTNQTLRQLGSKQPLQVYVGASSWAQKVWKGNLYPPKTKDADFLREYAKQFNLIELNATHYKMPDAASIQRWLEKTEANPDFRFSPKFYQYISHIKRLKGADEITTDFLETLLGLGDKLGPLFLQMSDNFSPRNYEDLAAYLRSLPRDLPIFTELRHADWFNVSSARNPVFELMHQLGIGTIITDTAGRRDAVHMTLTTPAVYLRFVGNALHPTDYLRIDAWVERFKHWHSQGLQAVYVGMHQSDELATPVLCDYLIKRINTELSLNIKPPHIIQPDKTLF
jgi:uncharacterized protein YecE (DUF72 family)